MLKVLLITFAAYICKSEPEELRNALSYLFTKTLPSLPTLTQREKLWKNRNHSPKTQKIKCPRGYLQAWHNATCTVFSKNCLP